MPAIPIRMKVDDAGMTRLLRKLADIDQTAATKAMRQGIGDATKVIMDDAKARVPRHTGLLKKSIGRKVKVWRDSKRVTGVVGPRANKAVTLYGPFKRGLTIRINPAKYAHLVEFGHRPATKFKGKVQSDGSKVWGTKKHPARGAAPQPFMRPAREANRGTAAALITERLRAGIKKVVRG